MNGLTIMVGAMVIFFLGYRFYGRWLEKTWGIDPAALTPAQRFNDGNDFSPQNRWSVFAHQFTSITGAGPVTGPIIAAMFGWLPALLWMIVGGIFFGAVQDFTALYASVKNNGRSIGMLIEDYIGALGRRLFLLFCWLFTLLVIAAFCDMVANTFNGFTKDGAEILPNAAAGSISLIYMAGAILFGLYLKYMRPSAGVQLAVGIVLMVVMVWLGIANPIYLDGVTWRYVIFAYLFAAAVMPMWLLKNPRDYLSMFLLIGMIAAGVIGVIVINPSIELPAFVGFEVKNQPLFPILFVTIACGAVSGFHSLVSSGTPFQLFSTSVASFLTTIFGVPQDIAACILTMCVSALALTSVDAVARIGRMSLQELFTPSEGKEKNAVQVLFTNPYFATVLTLVLAYLLCLAGYMSIWPLFGSANQLLSALVLTSLAVFLKSTGRNGAMLYVPMTIMFVVTMTALGMSVWGIFGTIADGTFTFMVQGLQLILAIALMILALLVVWHAVPKLFGREEKTVKAA